MRKYIQDAWDESDEDAGPVRPGQRPLSDGELPPYDSDAT
jgi:sec-independent protein translocase protein TatB